MITWNSGESCIQDVTSPKQRCLVKGFNKDRHPQPLVRFRPGPPLNFETPAFALGFLLLWVYFYTEHMVDRLATSFFIGRNLQRPVTGLLTLPLSF